MLLENVVDLGRRKLWAVSTSSTSVGQIGVASNVFKSHLLLLNLI